MSDETEIPTAPRYQRKRPPSINNATAKRRGRPPKARPEEQPQRRVSFAPPAEEVAQEEAYEDTLREQQEVQFLDPLTGKPLQRRVSHKGHTSAFADMEIPLRYKKPGWDYQWWALKVVGENIDSSALSNIYEGGWRQVPRDMMPDMCPPGWTQSYIERNNQTLFMRPQSFTDEARKELYDNAEYQKDSKLRMARADWADSGNGLTKRSVVDFDIQKEFGHIRDDARR